MPTFIKAHAYGNDFLLFDEASLAADADRAALGRAVCDRPRGIGADGLIVHNWSAVEALRKSGPVRMALLNADGSYSEVSGNGVRCLAAWIASQSRTDPGGHIDILTDAGTRRLTLLEQGGGALLFRAAMGEPEAVTTVRLEVDGESHDVVTLRVGNPQCVVLGPVTHDRLHALASKLAVHPHFPHGTNVELATVDAPNRVRILIWERGVGPTEASGTGACAAAVAAMAYGGASRDVDVASPGGSQRVEWREDGLYLTGSAEIIAACEWHPSRS